jgi:hypothetical protein
MLLDLPVKVLEVFPPISTSTVSPKPYQFSCQSAHVILRSESSTANCWASGPMSYNLRHSSLTQHMINAESGVHFNCAQDGGSGRFGFENIMATSSHQNDNS